MDESGPSFLERSLIRRVGATAISTGAARGVLMVGTLLAIPIATRALGEERLGVWLTLVTTTSVLSFADLGLGNGIMTVVARSRGRGESQPIRAAAANGFVLLGTAAALALLVLVGLHWALGLDRILGVAGSTTAGEATTAGLVFFAIFAVGVPLTTVDKVQWGLARGYVSGAWALTGALGAVTATILVFVNGGGLVGAAAAYVGPPVAASALNAAWSWLGPFRHLRPKRSDFAFAGARKLLGLGGLYMALQIAAAVAFSADNFIVASRIGAVHVPELAVPARLFAFVGLGLSVFLTPLWPEYAAATGRGDYIWIRRTLTRSTGAAGISAFLLALLIGAIARPATGFLAPGVEQPGVGLIAGLIAWTTIYVLGSSIGTFLNGTHVLKTYVIGALTMALSVLVLKIWLVAPFGVTGLVWSGALGYLLVMGPVTTILLGRLLPSPP